MSELGQENRQDRVKDIIFLIRKEDGNKPMRYTDLLSKGLHNIRMVNSRGESIKGHGRNLNSHKARMVRMVRVVDSTAIINTSRLEAGMRRRQIFRKLISTIRQ